MRPDSSWNKNVPYPKAEADIQKQVVQAKKCNPRILWQVEKLWYAENAYCQLVNACRVGESYSAMCQWIDLPKPRPKSVIVYIGKKQEGASDEKSFIKIPSIITDEDAATFLRHRSNLVKKNVRPRKSKGVIVINKKNGKPRMEDRSYEGLKTWWRQTLGYNSHNVRYSNIDKMHEEGKSIEVMAATLRHTDLNSLAHYLSSKEAQIELDKRDAEGAKRFEELSKVKVK